MKEDYSIKTLFDIRDVLLTDGWNSQSRINGVHHIDYKSTVAKLNSFGLIITNDKQL
jgi:hypothetical protein